MPEQLESLYTLKEYMISSKGPLRDPSGLSASGMSEGQLSEAVQYFLANLERVLHFNRIAAEEVLSPLPPPPPPLHPSLSQHPSFPAVTLPKEPVIF